MKRSTRKVMSTLLPLLAISVIVYVSYIAYGASRKKSINNVGNKDTSMAESFNDNTKEINKDSVLDSYSEEKKQVIIKSKEMELDEGSKDKTKEDVMVELEKVKSAQKDSGETKPTKSDVLNRLSEINN